MQVLPGNVWAGTQTDLSPSQELLWVRSEPRFHSKSPGENSMNLETAKLDGNAIRRANICRVLGTTTGTRGAVQTLGNE